MSIHVTPIPVTSMAHSQLTDVTTSQHHVKTVVDTTRIFEEGGVQLGIFTDACPTGWTEYTTLRGRYPGGVPSGGTLEATTGTALSNTENRQTGQHTHVFSGTVPAAHTHDQAQSNAGATQNPAAGSFLAAAVGGFNSRTTGPVQGGATYGTVGPTPAGTNATAGSVASTNAPYVQLLFCTKD